MLCVELQKFKSMWMCLSGDTLLNSMEGIRTIGANHRVLGIGAVFYEISFKFSEP